MNAVAASAPKPLFALALSELLACYDGDSTQLRALPNRPGESPLFLFGPSIECPACGVTQDVAEWSGDRWVVWHALVAAHQISTSYQLQANMARTVNQQPKPHGRWRVLAFHPTPPPIRPASER